MTFGRTDPRRYVGMAARGMRRTAPYRIYNRRRRARIIDRFWRDEAPIIFVHISKTAGTSVTKALGQPIKTHPTAEEIRDRIGYGIFHSKPSFAVVRNPFDRLVSQFEYWRGTGLIPIEMPFDDWVHLVLVDRDPKWVHSDRWFMPQLAWVTAANDRDTLIVSEIARYESLEADVERILRSVGVEPVLPKLNQSVGKRQYQEYYSPAIRDIVAEYYEDDLRTWGYDY